jgi:hypothetical protein
VKPRAFAPALAVLSVLVVGCGGGQREADSLAAAGAFLAAIDRGDAAAACAMLAPRTREELVASERSSCEEAMGGMELATGQVREAQVWADRAQVKGDGGTLFLMEFSDGWKVSAAGCTFRGERPYECVLGGS